METKKVTYVDNSVFDSSVTDWKLDVEKKKTIELAGTVTTFETVFWPRLKKILQLKKPMKKRSTSLPKSEHQCSRILS
ncbi:hypothetical protein HanRHA438_Chr16g0774371 [Helianthus annuus]|nr:hypothetical protein HanRHA438_Chr16g0774371 [Helianthus annuus]